MGVIGFLIVYILYSHDKIMMNPVFIALFSFCFSMALGAVWEIFEFSMDSFFGLDMQKSGLVDTMWDLIVDSGGAIIAAVNGYFYVEGGDSLIVDRMLKKFIKDNPKLIDFHS